MQTIARANRVMAGKQAGEIIDYIGVFRNLQQALALYGPGSGGGIEPGDLPVEPKDEQAEGLASLLADVEGYASVHGVNLKQGIGVAGFDWVAWLAGAAEQLLVSDEVHRGFLARADLCASQWKAVKPHPPATDAQPLMFVIVRLAQQIRMVTGKPDISGVMASVERLLQESVDAMPLVIDPAETARFDLSEVDFDTLAELFAQGKRHTAAARLQATLEQRLARMVRENPSRVEFAEKLQEVIDRYNQGSKNIESFFEELKALASSLSDEDQRAVREELSEEELAVIDLLTKPEPTLTLAQEAMVKKVARDLVFKLKCDLLVLDWKQRQPTLAAVKVGIEETLDECLPEVYDRPLFARKSAAVFEHVFSAYYGGGRSIYGQAS